MAAEDNPCMFGIDEQEGAVGVAEYRFDVFGHRIIIVGSKGDWNAYVPGPDGKRRAAELVIPAFLNEGDLLRYLADIFHESARPGHSDARRIE